MVAASIASLTVYDMVKSADRWATIDAVRLEAKSGGKSGARRAARDQPRERGRPTLVAVRAIAALDRRGDRQRGARGGGRRLRLLRAVRDHSEGRAVVKLEYEAYASMAEAEMRRIVGEIAAEIPGTRMAVVHRTGARGGRVAVVCAASAPHRAEAFRPAAALIDRVKARAPIWKREYGPEGAHWVGWQDARCSRERHEP